MSEHATGTFDLDRWEEQPPYDERDGNKLTRVHIEKTFHGDLEGTSTAEIITVYTSAGPAAYVGVERFEGSVKGRRGSFILQHSAGAIGGAPWLTWKIVESSATGDLAGLRGEGKIAVADGKHSFSLDYDLG